MTEATALTIPAFFHAMRLTAQIIGQEPFSVVEVLDRGTRIAREHPVHHLLTSEPNEFQTASAFRETITAHAFSYGGGFAYIERNGNYRPTALIPLLPDRTWPVRESGRFFFRTTVNGQTIDLDPYNVLHLPGFSYDGLNGVPLVRLMKDTLGLSKAEELYAAAFFGNGCHHGGIVEVAGKLTPAAMTNLSASMAQNHGGLGNAFRTLFLEEGHKFTPVGVDPDKSQLLASRQFSLVSIAQVVGMSPHLLFDLSRATFSNIEHLGIEAVTYSFKPWANRWQQECNRKLLYESEKGQFECRLDLSALHAGDATSQAVVDKADFDMCAITPNERRAKRGRNPIDGGDEPFLNTAYLPLSVAIQKALVAGTTTPGAIADAVASVDVQAEQLGPTTPPADPATGVTDADGEPGPSVDQTFVEDSNRSIEPLRPMVLRVMSRLTDRDAKALANARRKHGTDQEAFRVWLASYTSETRSIVSEEMASIAASISAMQGEPLDIEASVEGYIASIEAKDRVDQIVNNIIGEAV